MPFDASLADRLSKIVKMKFKDIQGLSETRMFGGFGYLLNGNMCVGIHKDTLIIRVNEDVAKEVCGEPHVRPMDLTGRVMKGWATVEPEAMAADTSLERFVRLAVDFVATIPPKKPATK
ncbi:MAG: TfoX/Sxy family protein [Candidatus Hydrogenedentes bacterium]|nr:TfoX/Sxy family protein [Candidatus Hydrogenedentota bacterium]